MGKRGVPDYDMTRGDIRIRCREASCKWEKMKFVGQLNSGKLEDEKRNIAQAENAHYHWKHGVRKSESKKHPVGRPPKPKITVKTYQWVPGLNLSGDKKVELSEVPLPEQAQPKVIKIKFCPHCGERLPNAIVE